MASHRAVGWSLLLGAGLLAGVLAEEVMAPKDSERVVVGEVIDLSGYLMTGAHGEAHRDSAKAALAHGGAAAILTDDGQVILPLYDPKATKSMDLAPFVAQRVEVKGTAYGKGGVVGLVISAVASVPEPKSEP